MVLVWIKLLQLLLELPLLFHWNYCWVYVVLQNVVREVLLYLVKLGFIENYLSEILAPLALLNVSENVHIEENPVLVLVG